MLDLVPDRRQDLGQWPWGEGGGSRETGGEKAAAVVLLREGDAGERCGETGTPH